VQYSNQPIRCPDFPVVASHSKSEPTSRLVPAGTVLSASLTGRVGPNNSLDVGLREHLIEVYTGNGIVDLGDYSVPGIEIGRISHASGDSTDFEFDFTGVLHNLLAAGADYIGMRITPQTSTGTVP